jgi:hypothetical protein
VGVRTSLPECNPLAKRRPTGACMVLHASRRCRSR